MHAGKMLEGWALGQKVIGSILEISASGSGFRNSFSPLAVRRCPACAVISTGLRNVIHPRRRFTLSGCCLVTALFVMR